jgi:hypothetical protein
VWRDETDVLRRLADNTKQKESRYIALGTVKTQEGIKQASATGKPPLGGKGTARLNETN